VLRLRRADDRIERHVGIDENVRDVLVHRVEIDAEADREVGLRVEVKAENAAVQPSERAAEVDGCRGLPDATLLVRDRDDLAHGFPPRTVLPERARACGSLHATPLANARP